MVKFEFENFAGTETHSLPPPTPQNKYINK